jgi:hypothetical protein
MFSSDLCNNALVIGWLVNIESNRNEYRQLARKQTCVYIPRLILLLFHNVMEQFYSRHKQVTKYIVFHRSLGHLPAV